MTLRLVSDVGRFRGFARTKDTFVSEKTGRTLAAYSAPPEPEFGTCDGCDDSFPATALKDSTCKPCRREARS